MQGEQGCQGNALANILHGVLSTGISSKDREVWRSRVASLGAFAESAPLEESALATTAAAMLEDFSRTLSLVYRPERVGDAYGLGFYGEAGAAKGLREDFANAIATPHATHFHYDPLRPAKHDRNRVRSIAPSLVRGLPVMGSLFERNGLDRSVQTRVILCTGPVLLSWVGCFREAASEKVARRDAWAVSRLANALRRPLRLLRQLPPGLGPLFETALGALPGDAYLVSGTGRIQLANERGAARLASSFRTASLEVAEAVASSCKGHPIRPARGYEVHPVRHRGADLYIVHRPLDPAARLALRLRSAAQMWGLSAQQSSVLAHLANGRANKEVAAALGISIRTVESHVETAIKKAGVDSRMRLVAALWTAPLDES